MSFSGQQILFKSPINPVSGYGRDGITLAQKLPDTGCELHIEPKHVGVPLPQDILPLFGRARPQHFDVAINHEYPGELMFPLGMPAYADKVVGWTMYEFTGFGDNIEMTDKLRERLSVFDLVLAYDEVSQSALAEYMDEPDRLQILQGGYDAESWKPTEQDLPREWDGPFRFCMNGTMNIRKNPWATLFAFKLLKDEHGEDFDAELYMKTTNLALPPALENWCPDLHIHYDLWDNDKLKSFYAQMNCLLAPSWGEGKNLPALEAQTMGVPCIVSNVGGHRQWADESWTYLVDGPMEEHSPGQGSMRISAEALAEKMWYVYNNRAEAKRKGELASRMIPQQCDWSNVIEHLDMRIKAIKPKIRVSSDS